MNTQPATPNNDGAAIEITDQQMIQQLTNNLRIARREADERLYALKQLHTLIVGDEPWYSWQKVYQTCERRLAAQSASPVGQDALAAEPRTLQEINTQIIQKLTDEEYDVFVAYGMSAVREMNVKRPIKDDSLKALASASRTDGAAGTLTAKAFIRLATEANRNAVYVMVATDDLRRVLRAAQVRNPQVGGASEKEATL